MTIENDDEQGTKKKRDLEGDDAEAHFDAAAAGEAPPETQGESEPEQPLDGLVARIAAKGKRAAFTPGVLRAALALRAEDRGAYVELRDALKAAKVSLAEWSEALDEQETKDARAESTAEADDLLGDVIGGPVSHSLACEPYTMRAGVITWDRPTRDGDTVLTRIARFSARILANVELFDGVETRTVFEIEAFVGGRTKTVRVPAAEFRRMDWVETELGADAVVEAGPGYRDAVRAAIQTLSAPVPTRREYEITGWQLVGERRAYLHAGGALGAEASVHLPPALARLELPAPAEGDALRAAVNACLDLFTCGPADLVVPVFAAVWRAAIGNPATVVYIQAEPEVGKSTLAIWAQNHFGTKFSVKALPETWKSTPLGIAHTLATAGDCVLLIDDFTWRGDQNDSKQLEKLDTVVRQFFGGVTRSTSSVSSRQRHDRKARALPLITGEALPKRDSVLGRMILVLMTERLPLTPERFRTFEDNARTGVYASAMAAFLAWFAPHFDQFHDELPGIVTRIADEFRRDGGSPRNAAELAELGAGVRFLLRFALARGVLTQDEAAEFWRYAKAGLLANREAQREAQAEEEVCTRFMNALRDALASGAAHLASTKGLAPADALRSGWVVKDGVTGTSQSVDGKPLPPTYDARGTRIGFTDGAHVWIMRGASFPVAQRVARDAGEPLAVEPRGLTDRLYRRGLLAEVEKDSTGKIKSKTVRLMVRGDHMSGFLKFRSSAFWGEAEAVTPEPCEKPGEEPEEPDSQGDGDDF